MLDLGAKLRHRQRCQYFKKRGYKYQISQSTTSRTKIAQKLLAKLDPDYDAIIMLFDPELDKNHDDMLNLMGIVYRSPHFQNYDFEKSTILHLQASKLGNSAAAYNIAITWYSGLGGAINYEIAEYWLQRAHDLGHGCAISLLAPLLRRKYGNNKEINDRINTMYDQAFEVGGPWAWYGEAVKQIRDPSSEDYNPEKAINLLHNFTKGLMCPKPRGHAAKILALRYYLGLGVELNLKKSKKYLNKIPKNERDPEVRYRIRNIANKVNFMILTKPLPEAYKDANKIIQNTYETGQFPNRMPDTPEMSNQLWALCELAQEEGWANLQEWLKFWESVQAALIGVKSDQLQKSTYDFGPFYNKVDNYGFPVLGAYEKPGQLLSPIGGFNKISGVSTNLDGYIEIEGILAGDDTLTFVTDEDIDIAMILAFAAPQGPIYPSISIEPFDKKTEDSLRWTFSRKEFDPHWLGHTALGKTLYATDYWLGKLVGNSWKFNRNITGFLNDDDNKKIRSLLNEIQNVGGHDDGLWSRVMLKPEYISFDWKQEFAGQFKSTLRNAKIMVDGANVILHDDGTENRVKNLNDVRFHVGRAANLITQHYNAISEVFPIYERARQLIILMYALNGLRERDFMPNSKTLTKIKESYKYYQSIPKLELNERIVK